MEEYGVILISSTKSAMTIEKLAKERQLQVRIIPTPQSLQQSCGFSIKYALDEETQLKELLLANVINFEAFYHAEREGLQVNYKEVEIYK